MQNKVSILLINYNGLKFNWPCLDSLLRQSYKDFEIIFIDNNSIDWSLERIKKDYIHQINEDKIKIVENKHNYGFAEGNNIWASHTDKNSKYICLLNNDTILKEDRLEELVRWIGSDENLGIVGSLILDKWYEEQTKDLLFKQKKMWVNTYIMETSFRKLTDKEINTWILYTTWIGWCSLLYKREIIDQPFPSFYFAYGEDTYLSLCNILSWNKWAICTKSIVYHLWSWSFGKKVNLLKAFHWAKNQLCNILIFHTYTNRIKLIPTYLLYQWMKIFTWSSYTRFKGLCKAIWRCIRHKKDIKQQRDTVKKIQKISYKQFIGQLSDKIFENTYFLKIPKYQIIIMNILNVICRFYFRLVHIK
jgi:GT2 family glycosyltransferase